MELDIIDNVSNISNGEYLEKLEETLLKSCGIPSKYLSKTSIGPTINKILRNDSIDVIIYAQKIINDLTLTEVEELKSKTNAKLDYEKLKTYLEDSFKYTIKKKEGN